MRRGVRCLLVAVPALLLWWILAPMPRSSLAVTITNPSLIFVTVTNGVKIRLAQLIDGLPLSVCYFETPCPNGSDDTAAFTAVRAAAVAASSPPTVLIPAGSYSYSTAPNWAIKGVRVQGLGTATLNFTGTGNAWQVDFGSPPSAAVNQDVVMQNLTISGNAAATNGLYVSGCDHCAFRDIRVTNVSAAGVAIIRNTVSRYENIRVSSVEGAFTTQPVNGILIDKNASSQQTSACTIEHAAIEGVSGSGIKCATSGGLRTKISGGTSEGNARGIELLSGCAGFTVESLDLEGNTIEDIAVSGVQNSFYGMLAISSVTNSTHLSATAISNIFVGGLYGTITVDASATSNTFMVAHGQNSGAFTDNGTATVIVGAYNVNGGASEPLTLTGATLGASNATKLTLNNNQNLQWKDSGGTARVFALRGSDDNFYLGDNTANSHTFFFANSFGSVLTLRTDGATQIGSVTQANLPAAANGSMIYCSDCTTASACTGGGTGAFASRQNGAWKCL